VGLGAGRRDDAHVGGGCVGRAGQAEGGSADDPSRDDRQGEVVGEASGVGVGVQVLVSVFI